MNRREFERYLRVRGCFLHHHGGRHDVWVNATNGAQAPVPRHATLKRGTVRGISAPGSSVTGLTGPRWLVPDTVAAIVAPALPKLLAAWCREYDWIVLDSPPVFVAETAVLAQQADLILLVARPGVVERANLRHATESLERTATAATPPARRPARSARRGASVAWCREYDWIVLDSGTEIVRPSARSALNK